MILTLELVSIYDLDVSNTKNKVYLPYSSTLHQINSVTGTIVDKETLLSINSALFDNEDIYLKTTTGTFWSREVYYSIDKYEINGSRITFTSKGDSFKPIDVDDIDGEESFVCAGGFDSDEEMKRVEEMVDRKLEAILDGKLKEVFQKIEDLKPKFLQVGTPMPNEETKNLISLYTEQIYNKARGKSEHIDYAYTFVNVYVTRGGLKVTIKGTEYQVQGDSINMCLRTALSNRDKFYEFAHGFAIQGRNQPIYSDVDVFFWGNNTPYNLSDITFISKTNEHVHACFTVPVSDHLWDVYEEHIKDKSNNN